MRKVLLVVVASVLISIMSAVTIEAKVLSMTKIKVSEAHFFFRKGIPTQPQYVITDFGPSNINFLEAVDVVIDHEGAVEGVQLIYTPRDGFRREVFLCGIGGWMFKRPKGQVIQREITVRVITIEELFGS